MQFMLKVIQFVTVVGILGWNGRDHWAPTGVVAGGVAFLGALLVTAIIRDSIRFASWLHSALKRLNHKKPVSTRVVGRAPAHQLISDEFLNRPRHDGAPRQSLRNTSRRLVQ